MSNPPSLSVVYEGACEKFRASDGFEHAWYVHSYAKFSEGSVLKVRFRLRRPDYEVNVRAEVRHCIPGQGVGVEFLNLSGEAQMGNRGRNRLSVIPFDAERARDRTDTFRIPAGVIHPVHMRMLDRLARWKESAPFQNRSMTRLRYRPQGSLLRLRRTEHSAVSGALSIAGVSLTVREHFSDLGDFAILGSLSVVLVLSSITAFHVYCPFQWAKSNLRIR